MAIKREKVIRTAEKLVSKGKLEAAIKEYRKVLAENPNDANTLNRVGDLYARIERFDEAVKLFSQIADQYTRDGFFVKAIAIYKKIIKLAPQSLQVYERLAELYFRQGLLNEARTQYQVLADHYEKRDNATSAVNIYQRMTEIDPDSPAHYLKLAQLYQRQQLNDKALRAYRQLADLFLVNGSIDEATQVYLSALEAYGQELDFVREVVGSLHNDGHTEAAEKVLAKAVSVNPRAEAIGHEISGAAGPGAAGPGAAAPPPAAPPPAAPPPAAPPPAAPEPEITLDFDDSAFELPDVPEPMEPVGAAAQEDDGETVFTLDLDSDEPLATQVMPPADMLPPPAADDELDVELESAGAGADTVGDAAAEDQGAVAPEEIDWSMDEMTVEIDVDDLEVDELEVDELEVEIEEPEEIATAAAEEIAPEGLAPPLRHEDDLLAEAKVFAKYGLREKAKDRLRELLDLQPEHLGGLGLLARIALEDDHHDEALRHANEVARIARETGESEIWDELRAELSRGGLAFDDEESPVPEAEVLLESDRFARLLEDLDETATGLAPVTAADLDEIAAQEAETPELESSSLEPFSAEPLSPEPEEEAGDDLVTLDLEPAEPAAGVAEQESMMDIEELMRSVTDASGFQEIIPGETSLEDLMPAAHAAETGEPPPDVVPEPARAGMVSLADELDLGDLADDAEPLAAGAASDEDSELDETGMSWLDDVAEPVDKTPEQADAIFDEEDDFFDLAAELEAEIAEGESEAALHEPTQEQTLQDIIDGFKRGVAENLSSEDYDTHYNLGIAYREMGLLDEAIGEFQLASKDPRYIVDCSSMLGLCFLDKGLPELAIRWYKKGLESPALNEDQALGLLYDLGSVYHSQGDMESAYRTFVEIYGMNSNYRDVAQRIQELQEETAPS